MRAASFPEGRLPGRSSESTGLPVAAFAVRVFRPQRGKPAHFYTATWPVFTPPLTAALLIVLLLYAGLVLPSLFAPLTSAWVQSVFERYHKAQINYFVEHPSRCSTIRQGRR